MYVLGSGRWKEGIAEGTDDLRGSVRVLVSEKEMDKGEGDEKTEKDERIRLADRY